MRKDGCVQAAMLLVLQTLAPAVIEALRAAEDAEDAAEADTAWDEPGDSIPLDELEAEFGR